MSESESVNVISDKMLALVHDATNAAYNRACATEWGRGVKAAILAEKQTETALVEAIAELEAAQRWIPVSERLPKENAPVLVLTVLGGMFVDFIHGKSVVTGNPDFYELDVEDVTHWMPLPEPPEVQE